MSAYPSREKNFRIISDNIECISYENIDTGYSYSDHDPVYVKFKLQSFIQ